MESSIVHVKHLKRPFTIMSLKELLTQVERAGACRPIHPVTMAVG